MKQLILIAFTALLITSCGVTKKSSFEDKSTKETVTKRTTIIRPGDTLRIDIPNVRYKDTFITRTNYVNKTVATVHYDNQGNQIFECISAEQKEFNEEIIELIKNDKKDISEKETSFNPQYFIYALAVLVLIVIIGFVMVFVMIMKIKNSIPSVISQLK